MISCRRATEQISMTLDSPLTWQARTQLHLHRILCPKCNRCAKQLQMLQRICHQRAQTED